MKYLIVAAVAAILAPLVQPALAEAAISVATGPHLSATIVAMGKKAPPSSGDSDADPVQQMRDYTSDPKQSTSPGDLLLPGAAPGIHSTDSGSTNDSSDSGN